MNKMMEYTRGRMDGLTLAEKIVREGGLEALQREIRFRGRTGIHTGLSIKELNQASQAVKEMTVDTMRIMSVAVLHDDFGFGEKRCLKFLEGMERGAHYLVEDLATWPDYIESIKEQLNIEMNIRYNE